MSSWETFNPEDDYKKSSLRKRAEKRTVEQVGERAWLVHGNKKLGDAYPDYLVELKDDSTKYDCACYRHGRGDVRRRKMCSHVLAVILYRKHTHAEWVEVESTEDLEPAEGRQEQRPPSPSAGGGTEWVDMEVNTDTNTVKQYLPLQRKSATKTTTDAMEKPHTAILQE